MVCQTVVTGFAILHESSIGMPTMSPMLAFSHVIVVCQPETIIILSAVVTHRDNTTIVAAVMIAPLKEALKSSEEDLIGMMVKYINTSS